MGNSFDMTLRLWDSTFILFAAYGIEPFCRDLELQIRELKQYALHDIDFSASLFEVSYDHQGLGIAQMRECCDLYLVHHGKK